MTDFVPKVSKSKLLQIEDAYYFPLVDQIKGAGATYENREVFVEAT